MEAYRVRTGFRKTFNWKVEKRLTKGVNLMVTIKEVSQKSQVSIATVSHVLNHTKYVSDEVRQRVLDVVKETGYKPNKIAKSLKMKKSKTIGLIVVYIENPVYSSIFKVIEKTARANGYSVIVCNSDDNPDTEETQIEFLLSCRVDGLIVVPAKNSKMAADQMIPAGFPLVLLSRRLAGYRATSIGIDNTNIAEAAVSHLIEVHGISRIAAVIGERTNMTSKERLEGYKRALHKHNIAFDPKLVCDGHSTFQGGASAADTLINNPAPPEAVFIMGTNMMLGVMWQLKKMQVNCPNDIAVIGFSDSNVNVWMDPPLSSVVQPTQDMGTLAVESLLRQMEEDETELQTIVLPCSINYRRSCGCSWEPTIEMHDSDCTFIPEII